MLEPVGPLNSRVYWIRRAAVLAIVLVVVLLLVWITVGRGSGAEPDNSAATTPTTVEPLTGDLATSSVDLTNQLFPDASSITNTASSTDASTPAETPGTTAESATVVGSESVPSADPAADAAAQSAAAQAEADAAAAQAAAQAAADQAAAQAAAEAAAVQAAADAAAAQAAAEAARPRDAEGRLICPDTSVQLTATVGSPTYNVGQQPIVGVTVVNVGSEACVRDVSGSLQEYLAYDAAGTRVWSTNDCLPGTGTDVRFLQPGESLQYNIKWSGTTSEPGCAAARTQVPAGVYAIEVRIGTLVSSRASLTFQ